ncbi:MAG: HEAT repeat domain-containing protein [Acidobacteriota bacterium]
MRTFVGLFFVPLLVVILCVAVFIGFGWIAYDRHTTRDYLNDLRSGWKPRRAQAAYELSKILVADPGALDDTPQAREELRQLFRDSEPGDMRRYLALVLGYTQEQESVPLLDAPHEDPDSETRIYALWALGAVGAPAAREPLEEALSDRDPGIRKTAAFALGELGDAKSVAALQPILEDPVADVRWNAALAVSRLGSDTGIEVLFEMVDRGQTTRVPGITPAQAEDAMVSAVSALGVLGDDSARSVLEQLARDDPSLKVRRAAIDALKNFEG